MDEALSDLISEGQIESRMGFYFLPGRAKLVTERMRAYAIYLDRIQKTSRFILILRCIPFIRGIAVSGSLAGMYAGDESDIDFLVITKKGRIWLARLFLSFITQVLGIRRYGKHISKRICLNHYIVEDYVLPSDHNVYTALEYASLLVLLNPEVFGRFLQNQIWLSNFLANPPQNLSVSIYTRRASRYFQPSLEFLINILGGFIWEKLARYYQKRRIKTGDTVFVSDKELSFHPDSKGQKLLHLFKEKVG